MYTIYYVNTRIMMALTNWVKATFSSSIVIIMCSWPQSFGGWVQNELLAFCQAECFRG